MYELRNKIIVSQSHKGRGMERAANDKVVTTPGGPQTARRAPESRHDAVPAAARAPRSAGERRAAGVVTFAKKIDIPALLEEEPERLLKILQPSMCEGEDCANLAAEVKERAAAFYRDLADYIFTFSHGEADSVVTDIAVHALLGDSDGNDDEPRGSVARGVDVFLGSALDTKDAAAREKLWESLRDARVLPTAENGVERDPLGGHHTLFTALVAAGRMDALHALHAAFGARVLAADRRGFGPLAAARTAEHVKSIASLASGAAGEYAMSSGEMRELAAAGEHERTPLTYMLRRGDFEAARALLPAAVVRDRDTDLSALCDSGRPDMVDLLGFVTRGSGNVVLRPFRCAEIVSVVVPLLASMIDVKTLVWAVEAAMSFGNVDSANAMMQSALSEPKLKTTAVLALTRMRRCRLSSIAADVARGTVAGLSTLARVCIVAQHAQKDQMLDLLAEVFLDLEMTDARSAEQYRGLIIRANKMVEARMGDGIGANFVVRALSRHPHFAEARGGLLGVVYPLSDKLHAMMFAPDPATRRVTPDSVPNAWDLPARPSGKVEGKEQALALLAVLTDPNLEEAERALENPDWRFDLAGWDVYARGGWLRTQLLTAFNPDTLIALLRRGPPLTVDQANDIVRFGSPETIESAADLLPAGSIRAVTGLGRAQDAERRGEVNLTAVIPEAAWEEGALRTVREHRACDGCPTEYRYASEDAVMDETRWSRSVLHCFNRGRSHRGDWLAEKSAELRAVPLHGLPPTFVPANTYAARLRIKNSWSHWGFANQLYLWPQNPANHDEVACDAWDVGFDRRTNMVYLCTRRVVVFDFDDSTMPRADILLHCRDLARRTGLNLDLWETDRGVHAVVLNRTVQKGEEMYWVRLMASTACDRDYTAFAAVRGWAVRLTRKKPGDFVSRHLETIRVRDDADETEVRVFIEHRRRLTEMFTAAEPEPSVARLMRGEAADESLARSVAEGFLSIRREEEEREAARLHEMARMVEAAPRVGPTRYDVAVGSIARKHGVRWQLSRYGEWERA